MSDAALSAERRNYLRLRCRRRTLVRTAQIILLVSFFALWELAARRGWIDPFIMSCPSRIWQTFQSLYASGELFLHLRTSCLETVAGFLLGTAVGTAIAVLLWWSPTLARILDPYLVVLNSLPKTALGPVFIVWIGAGPSSIIAMSLAISLIVTILEMYNGFLATDPGKLRLMRTLGAGKGQILRKLVLPANFATLINALKVNVGLSWVGVIMGEFLVSRAGLGYLIVYGSQVFKMDLVMATVLLLAAAAAVMYQCVLVLEKALKKYLGVTA
ncbi:MAG: ABC transporter permease [Oscillospiraceae bacterium]